MQLRNINSKQQARPSQAAGHILDLAPSLQVELDDVIGNGIFCSGITGAGKTVLAKRIVEQIGKYSIPFVIFDCQGDWHYVTEQLPRGFVASYGNCPSGRDVLEHGMQVVYDLTTWPTREQRGLAMVRIIDELFAFAGQDENNRVPCYVLLDEAEVWLPQSRPASYDEDLYSVVMEAFRNVGERGRKLGITPALICHRISQIDKTAIAGCRWYILMQQTLHTDLKQYMDYVNTGDLTQAQMKSRISTFGKGKAIVRFPQPINRQVVTTFHHCESYHPSNTPLTQAALNRFAATPFDPSMSFKAFSGEQQHAATPKKEKTERQTPASAKTVKAVKPAQPAKVRTRPSQKIKAAMHADDFASLSAAKRVKRLLDIDSTLRTSELAHFCKCGLPDASKARTAWLADHK